MEQREVHRGEVFYADLSPVVGSEQGGVRPVLIVQNDVGNRFSPTVIAAAVTSAWISSVEALDIFRLFPSYASSPDTISKRISALSGSFPFR